MRHFISAIVVIFLVATSALPARAETYAASDAASLIGRTETIEGIVTQVSTSNGTTFINFGGRYPNHVFYGVIFRQNARAFPEIQGLEGQRVAITGVIEEYRGKPQIKLYSPSQIAVR